MSDNEKRKYGKEELELLNEVLDAYERVGKVFVYITNQGNPAIMSDNPKLIEKHIYMSVDKADVDYIRFALHKILKDNFDEDFLQEKLAK